MYQNPMPKFPGFDEQLPLDSQCWNEAGAENRGRQGWMRGFTLLSPKKKVGKAPNCYVGISPKGKNVKFLLVTLHVGTSPKFCVKLEYLRKGKNILFMSLTLHERFTLLSPKKKVGKAPNCYVRISPKGKNVKFLLVTLHVGTSPKFLVK